MLNCLQCGEQNITAQQFEAISKDTLALLCAKCQQLSTETDTVHHLLRQLPRVAAPNDFEMRLRARLARTATPETKFSLWAWPRWSLAGGGLAGLALAGVLWGTTFQEVERGQASIAFPSENIQAWPVAVAATITPDKTKEATERITTPATRTDNSRAASLVAPSRPTETLARTLRINATAPRATVKHKPRVTASETPANNSTQGFTVRPPGRVFSQTLPAASPTPSVTAPTATPTATPLRPTTEPTPNK